MRSARASAWNGEGTEGVSRIGPHFQIKTGLTLGQVRIRIAAGADIF